MGLVLKNLTAKAGDARDAGLILGSGIPTGVGNGSPFQYSHLENPMDRGTWWDIVHGVAKSQTQLSAHAHAHTHTHTNIEIHFFFSVIALFGYMPRSRIAGSYDNSTFSFLRNLHTVFHSDWTNLHSHLHYRKEGSLFSIPPPAFVICRYFNAGHSDQYEVVPHWVLICISPIISDKEHLFMCLLAMYMSSLEKYLLDFLSIFFLF